MSKYSPKQTKGNETVKSTHGKFLSENSFNNANGQVNEQATIQNKFAGMAEKAEVLEAVLIPGYKVRG